MKKATGKKTGKKPPKIKRQTGKPVKANKKAPKRLSMRQGNKIRVGIFGGNFDPFHNGHLNSLETVAQALRLARIRVIPAFQSPLRNPVQGLSPEQRVALVRHGIGEHDALAIDEREIRRAGVSYTVDTVHELRKEAPNETLFLIIGMDQFENFDQWKDFSEILQNADLVVTSRPGMELPQSLEAFPGGLRPFVQKFARKMTLLKSGRNIHFVQLNDLEVSATEIRKRVRDGYMINDLVPSAVAEYIGKHNLYKNFSSQIGDFERFTRMCVKWLQSKGAVNAQAYDLRAANGATEFTIIASGTSTRHTSALAEFLTREIKNQMGVWPQGLEGVGEGRWVVIDYGSLIVHVFYDFLRQEYRLEDLWARNKAVALQSI
ncbi:MAG: nicotinate (nicotinamide) nucleotide adenylyltransferase [Bdellovibrionales bacterium]